MGKPIAEAEGEIDKCAWNCEFYADQAERFLADEHVATYGRELAAVGIREFTNIRTFWVQRADAPRPATLTE
jgi:hypothetical protein